MDTEVVRTIDPAEGPELKEFLTRPGRRVGRIVIRGQNALGQLVCDCDCGETVSVSPKQMAGGSVYRCRSCAKYEARTPIRNFIGRERYKILTERGRSTRRRCEEKSYRSYHRYGGRGIRFLFDSTEQYALAVYLHEMIKGYDLQIDRIDNNAGYSASNIRLSTTKENNRNRECTVMFAGRPLAEIAEENGLEGRARYNSLKSAMGRHRGETGDEPSMEFVLAKISDLRSKEMRSYKHARTRAPLTVEGVLVMNELSRVGLAGNKLVYARCKDFVRHSRNRGAEPTLAMLRDYLRTKFPEAAAA